MEIFFTDLKNSVGQVEIDRFNNFSERLISAQTLGDVEQIMNDFNVTVFNHYFQKIMLRVAHNIIRNNQRISKMQPSNQLSVENT